MIRRRRYLASWVVLAVCAAGTAGYAQQRDRPAVTTARSASPHTGSVSGVVTLSPTSEEPVRRAVVSLISVDGGDGISTVTDDDGRFVVQGLPDGRYSLVAQKPAYLTNYYGAKRPGRAGVSIVIAKGQAVQGLRIVLPKGAVITGRVVQANGAPIRNVQVLAIPASQIAARGRFDTRARTFHSDDQGIYRIYGLLPGDYIVAALPELSLGDVERRTAAEYEEAVRALTRRTERPNETAAAEAPRAGRPTRVGYAPTYYPGTPVAADAPPVKVNAGEVRDGIDIPFAMFEMSEISGTVMGSNGLPTQAAQLSVSTMGPPLPLFSASPIQLAPPDAQGRFTISNVPPGVYTLTARGGGVTVDERGVTIRSAEQTEWAMTRVHVTGDDVQGVTLSLQAGLTFSGRVEAMRAIVPGSVSGTRVALVVPGTDPYAARSAVVDERGGFSVTGLHPETYEVLVTLPSALSKEWAVGAVIANGVDVRDQPLTFERGSIGDVAVTLTDQRTGIAGTLSTASGAPTSDYFVVIFPEARALWHPHSPRVRVVRPAADGSFSVRDLPAGTYRIAALTDVEGDEWRQASFLASLLDASAPIVVKEGMTTRQDLRMQ